MNTDFSALSDEELLLQSSSSDDALETLLNRYMRLVRTCSRPFFLVGGDNEDLMQEGMIGLLSAIRQFQPGCDSSFSAYAAACIRNRLISAVRSAAAQKNAPLNDSISFHACSFDLITDGNPEANPETLYIGKESFDEFAAALEEILSAFEKQVLRLYLNGLSYREIAELLHKSAKSVDNAVQRIRIKAARLQLRR